MLKFMQIGAKNAKHLARKDKIDTLNSKNEIENSNQVVEEICPQKTGSKLDQLRICGLCRGIGIRKVYYNHMVLDQNCEGRCIFIVYCIMLNMDRMCWRRCSRNQKCEFGK